MTVPTTSGPDRSLHVRTSLVRASVRSWLAAFCGLLSLSTSLARAEGDPKSADTGSNLNSVTVEANRNRAAVQRQVDDFVSAVAARPLDESLVRWGAPICPLVGGLPQDQAEFVVTRLSQIAASVGAPLAPAGRNCHVNFYIVATDKPDALIEGWRKRDARLFGSGTGPSIRRFVETPRPVRVWYNADLTTGDGMAMSNDVGAIAVGTAGPSSGGNTQAFAGIPTNLHAKPTLLQWNEVRQLTSTIVVVDKRQLRDINVGQLVDYIAMLTLTEVRQDADVGATGSILRLFADSGSNGRPAGLSKYDEAYLRAMYHSDQRDKMQLSVIETQVTKDLLR
jgi:hypothetical protein